MNYYGVTKWDQVLAIFEKGGALEGKWGWLATLRSAEVGDTISFVYYPERSLSEPYGQNYGSGEELFTGTLATENGMYYLSSDVGPIPLTYAEKFPCNGYEVYGHRGPKVGALPNFITNSFVATQQYPVFKHDPNKVDWISATFDATSVVASLIGANDVTNSAKIANKVGRASGGSSLIKSVFVDQTPNSLILSVGGLFKGPLGGGFSLASLFYDLGFYTTP